MDRTIRDRIEYLTVTSSSSCLVLLDGSGESISNSIMVSDKRAVFQSEQLQELTVFKKFQKLNSGFTARESLMIPKIMWLKENEPELFSRTTHFVTPNDYLIFHITGKIVTDILNAEKYYYSLSKKSYPIELLDELGIRPETLPPVEQIGFEVGSVTRQFKSLVDLPISKDIRVILSTYDAICAFFGSGISNNGEAGCFESG